MGRDPGLDASKCLPLQALKDTQITNGYHNLAHHGKNPQKLAQLERIDCEHMKLLDAILSV